jgi:hypothetical protein
LLFAGKRVIARIASDSAKKGTRVTPPQLRHDSARGLAGKEPRGRRLRLLNCIAPLDERCALRLLSALRHACKMWPFLTRTAISHDHVEIGTRTLAPAYVLSAPNIETVKATRPQLIYGAVPVYTRPGSAPTTITSLLHLYRCVLSRHSSALREPRGWLKRRYAEGLASANVYISRYLGKGSDAVHSSRFF